MKHLKHNVNGIHSSYLLMTVDDDVLVPFEYECYKTLDTNLKTNFEVYYTRSYNTNVVIDSRMLLTITYLSFSFDDLLIYDSGTNEVITFNVYAIKTLFSGYSRVNDQLQLKTVMFIYIFVHYFFCKDNPFNWSVDLAIRVTTGKMLLNNSISIECLFEYIDHILTTSTNLYLYQYSINNSNNDSNNNTVNNTLDITQSIQLQDNIKPLKDVSQESIYIYLNGIHKDVKYMFFN